MQLSDSDLKQLEKKGIDQKNIQEQLRRFREGFPYIGIVKTAIIGDGIKNLSQEDLHAKIKNYENAEGIRSLKFVPASGAASRMFKSLFSFLENYRNVVLNYDNFINDDEFEPVFDFFKNIKKFAFYDDLKKVMEQDGGDLEECIEKRDFGRVLGYVLEEKGLNYGNLPKGLLKFHRYSGISRTPVEEHLVEGANYCVSHNGIVHVHFTVPPDFMEEFKKHVQQALSIYEEKFNVKYAVTFSIQDPSTDTIAVDLNNEPFRDDDGSLLFRPGGHGALLYNLNQFDHDLIFIKNIDNVAPDQLKEDTILYKKALAGLLLEIQKKIFQYLERLEQTEMLSEKEAEEMLTFLERELCMVSEKPLGSITEKTRFLMKKLNRPLRVCGMVKNEGEPGGGPYWAKNPDGSISLQIIESSQVNMGDENQKHLFNSATHFNPVDIIAGVKDYRGKKFNLYEYVDSDTGFISKKSKNGRELKALELPGLWNGSMSDWNTIFVEVPISTFSPVKTVNDLLRDQHQAL
jgi:hypothetical protein